MHPLHNPASKEVLVQVQSAASLPSTAKSLQMCCHLSLPAEGCRCLHPHSWKTTWASAAIARLSPRWPDSLCSRRPTWNEQATCDLPAEKWGVDPLPVGPLVIMGEAVLSQGHGLGAILPRCPGTSKVRQSPRAQAARRQLWPLLWNPVLIRLRSRQWRGSRLT